MARRLYDPDGSGTVLDVLTEGYDAAFARALAM